MALRFSSKSSCDAIEMNEVSMKAELVVQGRFLHLQFSKAKTLELRLWPDLIVPQHTMMLKTTLPLVHNSVLVPHETARVSPPTSDPH